MARLRWRADSHGPGVATCRPPARRQRWPAAAATARRAKDEGLAADSQTRSSTGGQAATRLSVDTESTNSTAG